MSWTGRIITVTIADLTLVRRGLLLEGSILLREGQGDCGDVLTELAAVSSAYSRAGSAIVSMAR